MIDQNAVRRAKEYLKIGRPIPESMVRSVIKESWLRCRDLGTPMENGDKRVLPPAEVDHRITHRRNLCQVAFPYLDSLYDFIKGSEFLVLLSDEEGYILYVQGDPGISEMSRQNGLVKGACRSEKRLGTNGVGTVLATQAPLQVFGAEHYYEVHSDWVCSGAPLYLPDGTIGGVVCLSGMADKVNHHTLGMAVAAADAISRQLKLKDAYDRLTLAWKNLSIIIETVPTAICLLDENLNIVTYNAQVTRLLNILPQALKGRYFLDLIGESNISEQDIRAGMANRPVSIEYGAAKLDISLSIQATGKREYVVQMEALTALHKRANNIVGNDAHFAFSDIIGQSPTMQDAIRMAEIAARNDATVFLSGESGTGKELFAQAIHNASSKRNGPFIAVNCGALPKSLIEAELFGYEGGSFTGAKREGCAGKFELANGGTIFLDEIGDMPFDVQVTLLRVIQSREVRRIGSNKTVRINVRIITATNQNLERLVADKAFREDLFYRINVFQIRIPPLRERTGDIQILSQAFLRKYGGISGGIEGFSDEAMALMEAYTWPGNVRQLENMVERAVYLAVGELITPAILPPELKERGFAASNTQIQTTEASLSVRKNEQAQIIQALSQTHGNVKEAARLLEFSRRTLYRKLELYGIDCDTFRR